MGAGPENSVSGDDAGSLFGEAEGLRAAGRMDEAESHYYRALELYEKAEKRRRATLGGESSELEWSIEARGPLRAVLRPTPRPGE